jgi:hypothetical protein
VPVLSAPPLEARRPLPPHIVPVPLPPALRARPADAHRRRRHHAFLRRPARGGVLAWIAAALVFCAALAVLAWMLLLPVVAQTRFASATGTELRLRGLMGDPFAGRATVTGWTLRATSSPQAPVLARGGASEIVSADWQAALGASGDRDTIVIDSLTLHAAELHLAPDAKGRWPLLALGASAGLPYERDGKVGDGPRMRVTLLTLRVDNIVIRDATTGRDTSVRIDWSGEFRDLDHSRPVVAALLAAAAGKNPAP